MSQTEYKVRSIQTPVVDKLDPSQSFIAQLRRATKQMDNEDAAAFKNVQESLIKAKKDKMSNARDLHKQLAAQKQAEEEAELEQMKLEESKKINLKK